MQEKAIQFLGQFTRGQTNCSINYKPYEYGNLVQPISFAAAVEKFMEDFKEMHTFLQSFGIEDLEKVFDCTCRIWEKHIVTF